MFSMVLQGFIITTTLVCSKVLTDWQWPFFRISALSSLLAAMVVAAFGYFQQSPYLAPRARKWVLCRALFGVSNGVLLLASVRVGTSSGDAASLASVQVVLAALLGRVFLGEPLHWIHAVSVCCCMCGAVLISQPRFLMSPERDDEATPWFGYFLAIAAGCAGAGIAVSLRKAGKTSLVWPTFSTCLLSACVVTALIHTPLVHDFSMQPILESPGYGVAWTGILCLCTIGAVLACSAGGAWCPAAVSSTIGTASRMLCGYLAELFIFGKRPEWLTACGAALMLVGVIVTTRAADTSREQGPRPASPDDEIESRASFVAAEFAVRSPHVTVVPSG